MASCGALPSVGGCELSKRPWAGSLMISIGRLMNDAPGRPNAAARKPLASTSDSADDEVTSAANLVTGRNMDTVSIVWCTCLAWSARLQHHRWRPAGHLLRW